MVGKDMRQHLMDTSSMYLANQVRTIPRCMPFWQNSRCRIVSNRRLQMLLTAYRSRLRKKMLLKEGTSGIFLHLLSTLQMPRTLMTPCHSENWKTAIMKSECILQMSHIMCVLVLSSMRRPGPAELLYILLTERCRCFRKSWRTNFVRSVLMRKNLHSLLYLR